ncbi:MAG: ribosome recycling factor [Myxococcota bacterium]|jgi:ribosome recycling factor|nr:ribosome recycling factor [Deltaproteobacteria bacterium]MCP4240492.1 ribosome recycling factor [bacterium]MDP6076464.1 ribosome recycling factor [Myxococcota bacterium]MDP6242478.1 ribosome recycling factor [Myxococcota bacterium]MDP7073352.1 ribosome recycling factor [Myxococcota bacterium]
MAQDDVTLVREEAQGAMEKSLRSLKAELQKVRTGRANTAILDGVQVDYYGTPTPLNQLANLTTPDPRLIVVSPYDKGSIQAIEKAIQSSDLGLTPSSDGKVVRIPIPSLTEERRNELVKHVHRLAEDHKVGVREGRRDALSMLKDLVSDGSVPRDEGRQTEKAVQGLTDGYVKKIDEVTGQKEKEILEV